MQTTIVVKPERVTQNRVVGLLKAVHPIYEYVGYLDSVENSNIIDDDVTRFLRERQGCTPEQASEALRALKNTALCSDVKNLYNSNKAFYNLIRYRKSVRSTSGEPTRQIAYIDWTHPENNIFKIAEEVTIRRNIEDMGHRRPDIVIYVNGIALVVIELKKASVSVSEGIRQNFRNQEDGEIFQFFSTVQLLMAGSDSEGLHYGVIKTPEKYYLRWKEPVGSPCMTPKYTRKVYPNELDRSLVQMLEPGRLLEFIHDFIIFDGGIKKAARPNQYFGIKMAQERILKNEGGIIWHSQGSGKSLTMIWLAQWIRENISENPRVLIITDRDELDSQISTGFANTDTQPQYIDEKGAMREGRVTSGNALVRTLNSANPPLVCSLIHKFGAGSSDYEAVMVGEKKSKRSAIEYLKDAAKKLPEGYKAKGKIFVFVDECHRSQGGVLHEAMKMIVGENVIMIGFTGTPLMSKDKSMLTSQEQFGPFIHTYRFDEAVADKVILDLRYEPRSVEQKLSDKDSVDAIFDNMTKGMTLRAKEALSSRWATIQELFSSRDRMQRIVADICKDMMLLAPLSKGYGNAMLVAGDIYQAYRYWEMFQNTALKGKCAVVTSYDPSGEVTLQQGHSSEMDTEAEFKRRIAKQMMGDMSAENFETWAKQKFIKEPAQMKLLIVVDKLLTGFDAPPATFMYIDKKMEDHNLFQAICRVNRLDGTLKDYGYIIDYKDLFNAVRDAIDDYTNGGFASYSKEDVEGLLKNRLEQGKKDIDSALEKLHRVVENVAAPKSLNEYYDFFVYDSKNTPAEKEQEETEKNALRRKQLYDAFSLASRCYLAIATQMIEAGYTEEQAQAIHAEINDFDKIVDAVMLKSGDKIDYTKFNAEMRQLLDDYVSAEKSVLLEDMSELKNFSFLDIIEKKSDEEIDALIDESDERLGGRPATAETLVANARKVINRKFSSNPTEYKKLSEKLNRLLADIRKETEEYKQLLRTLIAFLSAMNTAGNYDAQLDTAGKRALYDNMGKVTARALRMFDIAAANAELGWRNDMRRRKKLERAVKAELAVIADENISFEDIMSVLENNEEF